MSDLHRTPEEYTSLYADQHTDGNIEVAAEHAMVKEVCKNLKEEQEE